MMKRGKYEAPRRRNPMGIFWIILIVFLVLGIAVLCRSCSQEKDGENPPPEPPFSDLGQSQPSQEATTDPSTAPTTVPVTQPTTEPVTEPTTEPVTEPTTDPTEPDEEVTPEPDSSLGLAVVATARSALGKTYAQGGAGPDSFDTSGLVSYCFRENGISVPRRTSTLFESGEAVEKEDLQPGDVVFFYLDTPNEAEYPGIYTGDGTFIAVSSSQNAVLERKINSSYYTEHYVAARRYISDEHTNP